jgi:hypothetical protein
MTQNRSEAYQRKIEYNKQKSRHLRHLYPNKRLQQNEKSKPRGQEKRMKAFQEKQDTVRILREHGMEVPWYLQNLKEHREYAISVKEVAPCPLGCSMCEDARIFFDLTQNHIISRNCPDYCTVCKAR